MAIALYEKTAGSGNWLLDHPDFRDVYETTFIKGTITDFQKLQDDPIKVAPLVKVEGYDDWLPLFFRPKDQYWDDDEHLAKDFNEEGKYFEKAWMSFRCEDEVTVMLQKGIPVAVIGFADGRPRIGEDLFRMEINEVIPGDLPPDPPPPYHAEFQATKHGNGDIGDIYGGDPYAPATDSYYPWNQNMKGPDGKPLGLTKNCQIYHLGDSEVHRDSVFYFWDFCWAFCGGDCAAYGWPDEYIETYDVWIQHINEYYYKHYAVLIPIGPILYRLKFSLLVSRSWKVAWGNYWFELGSSGPAPTWPSPYTGEAPPEGGGQLPWGPITFVLPITNAGPHGDWDGTCTFDPSLTMSEGSQEWGYSIANYDISKIPYEFLWDMGAALYRKVLMANPGSDEFITQTKFTNGIYYKYWWDAPDIIGDPNNGALKLLVRPHSPEEGLV